MENRIIELALEALEAKKAAVEKEIEGLKAELAKARPKPTKRRNVPSRSLAARKAQSERMKAYWARRRAAKAAGKKPARSAK